MECIGDGHQLRALQLQRVLRRVRARAKHRIIQYLLGPILLFQSSFRGFSSGFRAIHVENNVLDFDKGTDWKPFGIGKHIILDSLENHME